MTLDTATQGNADLSKVMMRLRPDPARVPELVKAVTEAGYDDPIWVELAGEGALDSEETAAAVLIEAVDLAIDGHHVDALRSIAVAAVKMVDAGEADLPWDKIRAMVVNRAAGGDTASELDLDGPLFATIAMARGQSMQKKAKKLIAHIT